MKKTLYLMRHGQTVFNVRKIKQGWCDSPLTLLGVEQAKVAGRYFKKMNIEFDDVYSSTSERACDTCELVTQQPYTRLKGLKEWNFGLFEGESEELNPPLPYGDFFVNYAGEGEVEFRERCVRTCTEIVRSDGISILAVAHGAFCAQFKLHWDLIAGTGVRSPIGNCSVLKFEVVDNQFKLIEIITHEMQLEALAY